MPDEFGRLHEPGKKKRSLFGLKHAEDTGAFEPINVTMGGGRAVGQAEPEEEYYPDAELAPRPAPASPKRKKTRKKRKKNVGIRRRFTVMG